jgi:hypothetical protein
VKRINAIAADLMKRRSDEIYKQELRGGSIRSVVYSFPDGATMELSDSPFGGAAIGIYAADLATVHFRDRARSYQAFGPVPIDPSGVGCPPGECPWYGRGRKKSGLAIR